MKHVPFVAALLVLAGLALAFALARPEPPDASLFGPQMALAPALKPLEAPEGTLALRGSVHHAGGGPAADVLVALVRLERLATVLPGPGLVAFTAVVVFTMLASSSFDPRLIWERKRAGA